MAIQMYGRVFVWGERCDLTFKVGVCHIDRPHQMPCPKFISTSDINPYAFCFLWGLLRLGFGIWTWVCGAYFGIARSQRSQQNKGDKFVHKTLLFWIILMA